MAHPGADARLSIHLESHNHPADVIDALVLRAFACGRFPFARSTRLERVKPDMPGIPAAAAVTLEARSSTQRTLYAEGDGYCLRIDRYSGDIASVMVVAVDQATCENAFAEITAGAVNEPGPDDEQAAINFWYHGGRNGGESRERLVATTRWSDIRRNYARRVAEAFDALVALDAQSLRGRLLLVHGPPGTGKTTALRALTHEWRKWCSVEYVLDPERLFNEASYLARVVFDGDNERPFRLLMLEDCDELIRADAKRRTGQALARVLNLADGLPGEGVQLLLAITTNEPLAELHPAIVRPGRCLAQIEVGRLNVQEARAWLGRPVHVGPEGATLAELFAQDGELSVVRSNEEERAAGQYL